MIKVVKKGNHIDIKGHALFDKYGKDIVCAAVSSIVITTVNGILSIDEGSIKCIGSSGYVSIDIIKDDSVVNALISNMINLLKELEEQYKKNIQVEEVD
ncbi:MAG: ribosomal-processing cysteine protease Prp [Bacilli bacterium]|nr:ribosomal-processing cysteine protease Prp [Bacilli bacterium]